MPSSEQILDGLTLVANRWEWLAIGWHVLLGAFVLGLLFGWRPPSRFVAHFLIAPLISVSALAWASANPFNGAVFGFLALALVLIARRLSTDAVEVASPVLMLVGSALVAFAWTYPHFLAASHWLVYTYAAPLGLLPCPTLSALIGVTLMLNLIRSRPWSFVLASAGLVYGVIGVFKLGVTLDYALLAGSGALAVFAARRRSTTSKPVAVGAAVVGLLALLPFGVSGQAPPQTQAPQFHDMFNGKDLAGWVNINTNPDTWKMRDGILVCSGRPIGVMCSEKQYENFVLHIEWMHMEAGGNSGVFVWSNARPDERSRLPNGVEVQMLELAWPDLNIRNGVRPPDAYVHGELFGVGGVHTTPDNPRGDRSMSIENRAKGKGEWNTYDVVAVDGTIKLAVNGKFVNGIARSTQKKGYFCLESEGGEIHFRNMRILELPPGVTTAEQTAPERK